MAEMVACDICGTMHTRKNAERVDSDTGAAWIACPGTGSAGCYGKASKAAAIARAAELVAAGEVVPPGAVDTVTGNDAGGLARYAPPHEGTYRYLTPDGVARKACDPELLAGIRAEAKALADYYNRKESRNKWY
jgi:hypothetical protein